MCGCRIHYPSLATNRPGFRPDRPEKPARLMPPRTTRVHHFRSLQGGRVPDDVTATETLASVSHARLCTAKHETR